MALTRLGTNAITALPAGVGGKVLQVVHGANDYNVSYNSTSATNMLVGVGTAWEVSITPTSASSKILTIETLFLNNIDEGTSSQEKRFFIHLYRKIGAGAYSAIRSANWYGHYYYSGARNADLHSFSHSESKYDEPNTTEQVTYKIMLGCHGSGRMIYQNGDSKQSVINLLEIAG